MAAPLTNTSPVREAQFLRYSDQCQMRNSATDVSYREAFKKIDEKKNVSTEVDTVQGTLAARTLRTRGRRPQTYFINQTVHHIKPQNRIQGGLMMTMRRNHTSKESRQNKARSQTNQKRLTTMMQRNRFCPIQDPAGEAIKPSCTWHIFEKGNGRARNEVN